MLVAVVFCPPLPQFSHSVVNHGTRGVYRRMKELVTVIDIHVILLLTPPQELMLTENVFHTSTIFTLLMIK